MAIQDSIGMKVVVIVAVLAGPGVWGQQGYGGGRKVMAVVPMVGKGTAADPRRPMYVATPAERDAAMRDGGDVLDYRYVLSDDGKSAIVEFSAGRMTRGALKKLNEIAGSREMGVASFEPDKHSKDDVEKEVKKHKKDFSFEEWAGVKTGGQK